MTHARLLHLLQKTFRQQFLHHSFQQNYHNLSLKSFIEFHIN